MDQYNVDALLVSNFYNVGYIAGTYHGNYDFSPVPHVNEYDHKISPRQDPIRSLGCGYIVVPRDENKEAFAVVHGYMRNLLLNGSWIRDVHSYGSFSDHPEDDPVNLLWKGLVEKGFDNKKIGIDWISFTLLEELRKKMPKAQFKDAESLLWRLREVKSEEEIRRMRKAADATVKAMNTALDAAEEGMTEIEFTNIMHKKYIEEGCDMMWSEITFGFRPKQAFEVKGFTPTENKLKKGDYCLIDGGGFYKMYVADMCRCFWFGRDPTSDEKKGYETLLNAMDAARAKVWPGVKCSEIYRVVKEILVNESYGSAGHGVGLRPHESPCLSDISNETLEEGMVVTLEIIAATPVEGRRQHQQCEDMILVTKDGAESFTELPKWIII